MKNTEIMSNTNIYQTVSLKPMSALQKLFKQNETDNAIIELNNLLAAVPILEIKQEQVGNIARKYKVNLVREFERNIDEFYGAYLNHCLIDKVISDSEVEELKHLKAILGLNDTKVNLIHEKLTFSIYKQGIDEVIADGRISKKEEAFLEKLRHELRLPDEIADKISSESRVGYFNRFMDTITADGKLSPEEVKEMDAIAKSLRIDVKIDNKNKATLERMKELWRIENMELQAVQVDFKLGKGEICYYTGHTSWYEFKGIKSNGRNFEFKATIPKGQSYQVGGATSNRMESDLKYVDHGQVYITDRRIAFGGAAGNKNLPYTKILGFTPFMNGLELEKDAGKDVFLKLSVDMEVIGVLFSKVLKGG